METTERRLNTTGPKCPNCGHTAFVDKIIDPSLFSTPEIWTCRQCGTESRWLKRKTTTRSWLYIDAPPSAEGYQPSRLIHSARVHANRHRARALLPASVVSMIAAQEARTTPKYWQGGELVGL